MVTSNGASATARVILSEADGEAGFASVMCTMIEQNLAANPERERVLDGMHGVVHIRVADIDSDVALHFDGSQVVIDGSAPERAHVRIQGTSEDVLNFTRLPLVPALGVPNPADKLVRQLLVRMLGGDVTVRGLLRNPLLVLRMLRLVSVL